MENINDTQEGGSYAFKIVITESKDDSIIPGKAFKGAFIAQPKDVQVALADQLPGCLYCYHVGISTLEVVTENGSYTADVTLKAVDGNMPFRLKLTVLESNDERMMDYQDAGLRTYRLQESSADYFARLIAPDVSSLELVRAEPVPGLPCTIINATWRGGYAKMRVMLD